MTNEIKTPTSVRKSDLLRQTNKVFDGRQTLFDMFNFVDALTDIRERQNDKLSARIELIFICPVCIVGTE